MKSGIGYEQGEIVLVPFPFSDLSGIKQRPVLILSKKKDNILCEDVITCGITGNISNEPHSIIIENRNLMEGTIPIKSRIKVDKLFTLSKEIINKKIARINKETFEKVKREFFELV